MNNIDISTKAANNIRVLAASMVEKAKSGHPGGAMGGADFIHVLYSEFLNFDPTDSHWFYRDRFFLDPGHMSPMLYAQLALINKFSMTELSEFRQWGSPTPGHPERDLDRAIENTSGPLGQGHTMAVGAAIAAKFLKAKLNAPLDQKIYAFISDGGIQEEISQGAGRIAGHLGLDNLIMFYDANQIQLSTKVEDVTSEDVAKKYDAWGWNVITINGNKHEAIRKALKSANETVGKPSIIIGNTTMGLGAVKEDGSSFESMISTHGQPLSNAGASYSETIKHLGGEPNAPFQVFTDVSEYYKNILKTKEKASAEKKKAIEEWEKKNTANAKKLAAFTGNQLPKLDWASVEQKENAATRASSATVLSYLAKNVENMIVASADLANSDKTDGFLKETTAINKNDFSGQFLQAGVAELTMASIANGMALHGGVIPVVGTFFVFSDYMKPALRLSALMELPVVYLWTHDAFRVGEDGPTHQPIEQEAQLRLMEHLKNHSGKASLLALRPCDSEETTIAWKMALENKSTPSALILSRQNIKTLPGDKVNRKKEATLAEKGGYVVKDSENPQALLIANGSEVSTLVDGAALLEEKGINTKVVSVISEGLFRAQSKDYQEQVLPAATPKFGLTAGLPTTLLSLVGSEGKIHGLDHFGYSAPAGVLDEKFGFTAENVSKMVEEWVKTM